MKIRVSGHQVISPRTRKLVKGTPSTSVRHHMFIFDRQVIWEDFRILGKESTNSY